MFSGSIPALVTPFRDGALDEAAFCRLVEALIAEGSSALVPCGTTGESPTLSHEEHMEVVELCIKVADARVPVIAGAGSNSTAEAVMLAQHAEQAGASAVLTVSPYYNRPSQEGLFQHFSAVHDSIGIPIVLYNIPGRSVVDISTDTMVRLARLPRIAGVKEIKTYKAGKLPDGHIHSRCKRYAVKQFIADWWAEAYRDHFKKEPPLPYPIAILGHAHLRKAA